MNHKNIILLFILVISNCLFARIQRTDNEFVEDFLFEDANNSYSATFDKTTLKYEASRQSPKACNLPDAEKLFQELRLKYYQQELDSVKRWCKKLQN